MVWVDIPVLHPPYDVDTAVVIVQYIAQMVTLFPVIRPISTTEFRRQRSGYRHRRPDDIITADSQVIGGHVGGRTLVGQVIADSPGLTRAITIEHLLDADTA